MAITAQEVNKLRQMTGAGMMDCKKALVESDGDFDKAIEILRKKGQKVSEKRAGRQTNEGSVFVQTNDDETISVVVGLGCETDFVAKNEDFKNLGNEILKIAADAHPGSVDELKTLKNGDLTIGEKITELVGKIGEKIDIVALEILEGEKVVPYIHAGSKLSVLVALKGTEGTDVAAAGRDVAMQIAAMRPVAVDKDGVDTAIVEKELKIGREQAIAEGKPEHIIDKIAEGKLNKFYKENTLLNQAFVKDNSMTVGKYLDSVNKGLTVETFKRVSVNQ
ncbi:MAG: elongation factor Ts [Cyclobacteriaceae bacterium]|nr:elongation factor Ts [Cyclobacteriaceae bacterium]MCK5208415.1 elongation factor Ts [Cyclobacteriaceae bacterium]MCK5369548.1 elongation factor Ts [Cyclobacteriaceae bacterium]